MSTSNVDFALPQNGYMAFDALTMKALLKERLNKSGVYTDQDFEGSNIAQIIDIFAYTFNTLIYYMNKTASEGMFSDAQIYENINRIVKAIGYNPIGYQTSIVSFDLTTEYGYENEFTIGQQYTLPRYSNIMYGGTNYVTANDIDFVIQGGQTGSSIKMFGSKGLLYEGSLEAYPMQYATGNDNEITYLNPGNDVMIDHFTIDVYVKHNGKWAKWEKTPSLYLNNANDKVYEIRRNETGYYEIKTGDNICGMKLDEGDEIQIFYIRSTGNQFTVGQDALSGQHFVIYSNDVFTEIMQDIHENYETLNMINNVNTLYLKILSNLASTYYTEPEDPDSIRKNAPGIFRMQYRLVTSDDFKNYVQTNFANLVQDVAVLNNWAYLSTYIKYFYDHGMTNPNNDNRVLVNQVLFADACNFNNVYIFAVPKIPVDNNSVVNYMSPALKTSILQSMQDIKTLTCEPIIMDPMYIGFDIGIPEFGEKPKQSDQELTKVYITKKSVSRRDVNAIKNDVVSVIVNYFNVTNCKLGMLLNVSQMVADILAIDGVESITTQRIDDKTQKVDGLSFVMANPVYPDDITQVTHNFNLESYQFPYVVSRPVLESKIEIITSDNTYTMVEY